MIVWRLAEARYARDLSGIGSRIAGGRWNEVGSAVLYASEHLALAALETLVHAPGLLQERFLDKVALQLFLPDHLNIHKVNKLPGSMKGQGLLNWCRSLGQSWIREEKTALLRVPSVVVPEEFNLIVNCSHPDMKHLRIKSSRPFEFDKRLFR